MRFIICIAGKFFEVSWSRFRSKHNMDVTRGHSFDSFDSLFCFFSLGLLYQKEHVLFEHD